MSPTNALFIWASIALLLGCLVASIFWKDRSEEFARDDEAEELRCQVQGVGIHGQSYGRDGGARS